MAISRTAPFVLGLALTAVGSFLPWQAEGDFLNTWTLGVRVFPSFQDNGGLVVLLVSSVVALLSFRAPSFIEKPERWIVALSAMLTLDAILHVVSWLIALSKVIGIVGAPSIEIGLIMVCIGSVMLLVTSLWQYRAALREAS